MFLLYQVNGRAGRLVPPSGRTPHGHSRERCTHLGSTKPPSAPGNSRTLRRGRFAKIFLFAPGAWAIRRNQQARQTPAAARKPSNGRPGQARGLPCANLGGPLSPQPPLPPLLFTERFPGRLVLFRRYVLFGLLPAVGTRLRGQNEPIFQGSFCRFPVREVSGIGLQPCPPSGAAQPPPAGTESAHLWACASSVCICIALHIERLTGLYAPRRFTASARPHLPFYAR